MSYLPLKIAGDLFYGNFSLCISFDIENIVMTYSAKSCDLVTDIYKQNVTYEKRHPISDTEKRNFFLATFQQWTIIVSNISLLFYLKVRVRYNNDKCLLKI